MDEERMDDVLKERFAELREEEAGQAPSFQDMLARARGEAEPSAEALPGDRRDPTTDPGVVSLEGVLRERSASRSRRWIWVAGPLIAAGLAAVVLFGGADREDAEFEALVTAFATGSVFVVLPILSERSKELLRQQEGAGEEAERIVDVVVPISFTLASAGKLLTLSFVLFAGWLSGYPVPASEYPGFVFTGIFSFFASTFVAVPFLLDLYRIPADVFQLFVIADNVVGNRFGGMR